MRGYGLGKVLDDAGVSMYFCGHEHVMQFKKTSGGVAQCVSGAVHGHGYYGGPAYPDTMRAEADWHDDPHGHGFVAARIGSAEAKIEFVRASTDPADAQAGKTLHEVVLPKTPAEGQPPAEPEGSAPSARFPGGARPGTTGFPWVPAGPSGHPCSYHQLSVYYLQI